MQETGKKMKRKKLALAVMLALLVVGVALGVHLMHKSAYAVADLEVYIHSGLSPITGLTVTFSLYKNGVEDPVEVHEAANGQQGEYHWITDLAPQVDFDEWEAKIDPQDVGRLGLVMIDPDSNPIPRQDSGTTFVDWEVIPDMR
jgi:hypothetical protein